MKRIASAVALTLLLGSCGDDQPTAADACPEVEAGPDDADRWTTADGCPVATDVIFSHAGPSECGWELIDVLVRHSRTYHWDPVNFLAYVDGQTRNRTLKVTDLGADVIDTGLRRGDEQLWEHAGDPQYVYVVNGDFAERYLFDAEDAIACGSRGSRPQNAR